MDLVIKSLYRKDLVLLVALPYVTLVMSCGIQSGTTYSTSILEIDCTETIERYAEVTASLYPSEITRFLTEKLDLRFLYLTAFVFSNHGDRRIVLDALKLWSKHQLRILSGNK